MPTYLWRCSKCGWEKATQTPINDIVKIPECLNCDLPMRRQYQPPAITFKGTGWGRSQSSPTNG